MAKELVARPSVDPACRIHQPCCRIDFAGLQPCCFNYPIADIIPRASSKIQNRFCRLTAMLLQPPNRFDNSFCKLKNSASPSFSVEAPSTCQSSKSSLSKSMSFSGACSVASVAGSALPPFWQGAYETCSYPGLPLKARPHDKTEPLLQGSLLRATCLSRSSAKR